MEDRQMALLGIRWVRAIYLDAEVRADWQKWVAEFRAYKIARLVGTTHDMFIHHIQGQLQALDEVEAFIERAMAAQRADDNPDSHMVRQETEVERLARLGEFTTSTKRTP